MSQYFVEVYVMNGNDWTSYGFHKSGYDTLNEPLVIAGKEHVKPMQRESANFYVSTYRSRGHRARIIDSNGTVVLGWEDGIAKPQDLSLHNSHTQCVWRDTFEGRTLEIPLIFNRSTRVYYGKIRTSPNPADPPDISVAGGSPQEVFERVVTNPFWRPYLGQFVVTETLADPAAAAAPQPTVNIAVPEGFAVVGTRPGSIR